VIKQPLCHIPCPYPCHRLVTSHATGIAQFFQFLHCQESHASRLANTGIFVLHHAFRHAFIIEREPVLNYKCYCHLSIWLMHSLSVFSYQRPSTTHEPKNLWPAHILGSSHPKVFGIPTPEPNAQTGSTKISPKRIGFDIFLQSLL